MRKFSLILLLFFISLPSDGGQCGRRVGFYSALIVGSMALGAMTVPYLVSSPPEFRPAVIESGRDYPALFLEAERRALPVKTPVVKLKHRLHQRLPAIFIVPQNHTCLECQMNAFGLSFLSQGDDKPIFLSESDPRLEPHRELFYLAGIAGLANSAQLANEFEPKTRAFLSHKLYKVFASEVVLPLLRKEILPKWEKQSPHYDTLFAFIEDIERYEKTIREEAIGARAAKLQKEEAAKLLYPYHGKPEFVRALASEVGLLLLPMTKEHLEPSEYDAAEDYFNHQAKDPELGNRVDFFITRKARNTIMAQAILDHYVSHSLVLGQDLVVSIGAGHAPMVWAMVRASLDRAGLAGVAVRVPEHFVGHKEHKSYQGMRRIEDPLKTILDKQGPAIETSFDILK